MKSRPPRRGSAALLAIAVGVGTALLVAMQSRASPAQSTLTLKPCRLPGFATELQCGTLARPLNPAEPAGTQIQVHVAVIPALARNKLPDPVTFLAGGPGQSAIDLLPMMARRLDRLNQRRDLVFVDQRGTGKSAPLKCDEARDRTLPLAEQLDPQATLRRLDACRSALQQLPHGDLRQYTTTLAMQDLDAVRQALGVAQWNVIGGSYGTRAGLEYLRQFPGSVRRAVLDGLAPPDMVLPLSFGVDNQAALDALLAACAAQPGCAAAYPQLATQWRQLLASLPREVTLTHALTGKPERARIEREHVLSAVRTPLYVPHLAAALPAAIQQAAAGDFNALGGLMTGFGSNRATQLAGGMHFSVICAEDAPRIGETAPSGDFGPMSRDLYRRVCADWPRGAVPAAFYTVPAAQSPVLLLSGGADPVTPPRHGERVATALGAQARHQVVAQAGHGVMSLPCMRDPIAKFIEARSDTEALAVKTDCAAAMPRPLAFVPPNPLLPAPKKELAP